MTRTSFLTASLLGKPFSDMVRVVPCHAGDRGSNPTSNHILRGSRPDPQASSATATSFVQSFNFGFRNSGRLQSVQRKTKALLSPSGYRTSLPSFFVRGTPAQQHFTGFYFGK